MKPLIILLIAFAAILVATKVFSKKVNFRFAANAAMSLMLVFTALGHFMYADGMAMMIPEFIPYKSEIIFGTGVVELTAAVGLLMPRMRRITSILLIVFFLSILPANIYAAMHHVNFVEANTSGSGTGYLWFRIPLQFFFIGWIYYWGVKK